MSLENMDELTRLAAEELMKEASEFVKKRDINYVEEKIEKPTLKPNKRFLRNTVLNVVSSNNSRVAQHRKKKRDASHKPEDQAAKKLKDS